MTEDKLQEFEKLLTRKIGDHPTMQRLARLCDAMERIVQGKKASAPDRAKDDTDRAREDWKRLAVKAKADAPHG